MREQKGNLAENQDGSWKDTIRNLERDSEGIGASERRQKGILKMSAVRISERSQTMISEDIRIMGDMTSIQKMSRRLDGFEEYQRSV